MLVSLGVAQAFGLATGVITARFLGPFDRGNLALAMLVPLTVGAIADLGVERAAAYFSATRRPRSQLGSALLVLVAGQSPVATTAAMLFCWLLFANNEHVLPFAMLACFIIPLSLLSRYGQAQLQGQLRISSLAVVRLTEPVMYLVFLAGLVLTAHLSVGSAIAAKLASQSIIIGWSWVTALSNAGLAAPSQQLMKSLVVYGIRGYFRQFSLTDTFNFDQWAVGLWFGPNQLAYYVVAVSLVNVIRIVPTAAGMMVLPLYATGQLRAVRNLVIIGSFGGLVASLTLALLAGPGIPLVFGSGFALAIAPARILAVGSAALVLKEMFVAMIYGSGRPGLASLVEAASSAGLIAVLFLFAPRLGVDGVALAVVCSYLTGAITAGLVIVRRSSNY